MFVVRTCKVRRAENYCGGCLWIWWVKCRGAGVENQSATLLCLYLRANEGWQGLLFWKQKGGSMSAEGASIEVPKCRVLSLSDCRYSLNPLSQTRIDWVGRYRIRWTFKLSYAWRVRVVIIGILLRIKYLLTNNLLLLLLLLSTFVKRWIARPQKR